MTRTEVVSSKLEVVSQTGTPRREIGTNTPPTWLAMSIGLAAIGFSAVYVASDVLEVGQSHFSIVRLALTYAAEAAIPLFVLGLYALQRAFPAAAFIGMGSALLRGPGHVRR